MVCLKECITRAHAHISHTKRSHVSLARAHVHKCAACVCMRDNMHAYLRPSSFISDKKVLVSLFGVEQHGATGHSC